MLALLVKGRVVPGASRPLYYINGVQHTAFDLLGLRDISTR